MKIFEVTQSHPLLEGPNDPYIFKAIFMAGGPGSGKSYVAGKLLGGYPGLKTLNSDDIYEFLLSKSGLTTSPEDIFSPRGQEIRNTRAKPAYAELDALYKAGRLGMIIDGTGKDVGKISKLKTRLDALGYDTMMLFVNTDINTAQERNLMRTRSLPTEEVQKMWNAVQNNIGRFQQMFGNDMIIYDNSEDEDDPEQIKFVDKKIRKFLDAPVRKKQALDWLRNPEWDKERFMPSKKDKKQDQEAKDTEKGTE